MMASAQSYYYNQLNKDQQKAYFTIKEGLESLAPSFSVPRLSGKELSDLYFLIRMDHPEIFYSTSFRYRYYEDAAHVELIPEYMFDKKKILEHRQAMHSRIEKLARPAADLSELEKEQYIHDFICAGISYDKLKKDYSHEIIGALGQGISVCEGIAKSVKVLCDRLGIWCIVVLAEANPEKGIKYRHAWNVLKLQGKYYHLDVTFDNTLGKNAGIRYDYFNLSDTQIFRDHEPVVWPVPTCTDSSQSYYQISKLSFTKIENVYKRALQYARKDRILTFQWRGGYLTQSVFQELVRELSRAAEEKKRYAFVSVNWPQSVICVRFTKEAPQQNYELEDANEGEYS